MLPVQWRQLIIRLVLVITTATFLVSCATAGRPFAESSVREIVIGQTTKPDLRQLFGPPWRVGLEDGLETWTYGHYRYSVFKPEKSADLLVRFDDRGVVSSYSYSATAEIDR